MPSRYDDSEIIEESLNGKRVKIRFYCQECDHYIHIWLNLGIMGNYVMNCPICDHPHYRVVKEGKVTAKRFDPKLRNRHEIRATKSACVHVSKAKPVGKIAKAREMEAQGQLT